MISSATCSHCNKEFTSTHGNREYCPENNCQKEKKAAAQKKHYEVYKDLVNGFLTNYKLFQELLAKADLVTLGLPEIQVRGFDQNAFYGSVMDSSKKVWYLVKDFKFQIGRQSTDNKLFITIKR